MLRLPLVFREAGDPAAGNWYVMLHAFTPYTGVSLVAHYQPLVADPSTILTNGVGVAGISGATNSQQFFKLTVPGGQARVVFTITGGTGDADLYVRRGAQPTVATWDCRPFVNGNNETCTINAPVAGDYYVLLNGFSAYSGVTLKGLYP